MGRIKDFFTKDRPPANFGGFIQKARSAAGFTFLSNLLRSVVAFVEKS